MTDVPRYFAVEAHLRERAGQTGRAAELYARAAERAGSVAEREHLSRQAARVRDRSDRLGERG
jgi:predicted RNA polymerase sigma factor